jgi:hypothetical protein
MGWELLNLSKILLVASKFLLNNTLSSDGVNGSDFSFLSNTITSRKRNSLIVYVSTMLKASSMLEVLTLKFNVRIDYNIETTHFNEGREKIILKKMLRKLCIYHSFSLLSPPSDCIYYGLTKNEYEEWCERVHKILDSNNFNDFPEPDIKIVFK